MVGITRIGTYFPRRRLDRTLLAKAWGGRSGPGARTVAAVDEDALTLAVDAVHACLADADPAGFDALYFASTSAPYLEKQVASMIATAADLPRASAVADFGGSLRAGLTALRAALDGVGAGSLRHALVAAADVRLAEPGSELEAQFGDAGVAVAVGRDGVIAELVSVASVAEEFTHFWRTDDQKYVQVADARFGNQYGLGRDIPEAVGAALRKAELPAGKLAKLVVAASDARSAADIAKRIGCDPAKQLEASLAAEAGSLGTAEPLVLLAKALETASPGDFIAVAAFGEGADALVFRVTDAITSARPRPVADALAGGVPVASYERYLRSRNILPSEVGGEAVATYIEWKELKQDVRLYGSRCEACGLVQYPMALVCQGCHARERMVDHKLARTGTVFTFTIDNLAQVPEHPMPMVVVDLDGGGRVYLQGIDCVDGDIAVDKRVRLTFRRLHEAGGNRNYFWKVRPA
ncbi:MAG TPA: OB-fold domain-containing protein [Candidatus Binatia bacterium]|jgi:3-hydroxy-3-methylglutaryl CoA synthase/uncharacterized OB-fold protein|nr:OB-fold domain-containing protein [Candidatus Binatia bacterium]